MALCSSKRELSRLTQTWAMQQRYMSGFAGGQLKTSQCTALWTQIKSIEALCRFL